MFECFKFKKTDLISIEYLREIQLKDLKGQIQDPIEEAIITYNADSIMITKGEESIGYACIGTYEEYKDVILEYFLIYEYRDYGGDVIKQLANYYKCKGWIVNTQDYFALPIMLDLGLSYEINGYIFGIHSSKKVEYCFEQDVVFEITKINEINEIFKFITQDGFYTGGGIKTIEPRIMAEEIYSLRQNGKLVGVGFVDILDRTPNYADIAMIIDNIERKKGLATLLVKALINESRRKNLIPTALTGVNNKISRRTLQKAGFSLEGCSLIARI